MKNNFIIILALFFVSIFSTKVDAQVQTVKLTQVPGEFQTEKLTLAPGQYEFEIANKGVKHEVGFVLVPKGQYDATNHIKEAYVKETVATGKSSLTSVVNLEAGDYEYFCPLNPTAKYPLTVSNNIKTVKLTQVPGDFKTKNITLAPGQYEFEIANEGVKHEVGFVLVPKGQYDATNHIKEAYVKETVATGKSSLTSVVNLEAGDYEYFCPLNPTAKYPLTVSNNIKTVKLTQVPGDFKTKNITLAPGQYEFEIANEGVKHEVGFVLVPKGQYDATNHIKEAYVKETVATGKSSLTSVVNLEAGDYEYFCPLNPTAKYPLTVSK